MRFAGNDTMVICSSTYSQSLNIFCLFVWPTKPWQYHNVKSKEYSAVQAAMSQIHALQEVKVQRIFHEMRTESKIKGQDISP